jgi:divalent metal cation (Fe/Co/Zn/Cd) transporter
MTRMAAEARVRRLAWWGLGWHVGEALVALLAGLAAGSVALIGFGADSVVEVIAGVAVLWRFGAGRSDQASAERRAQQIVAASFVLIAVWVGAEAMRSLIEGHRPDVSWVGIGLAAVTVVAMPLLARAKREAAHAAGSSASVSEAGQTELCAWLSAALLAGLGANALLGWWWADPAAALAVAGLALYEGRQAWRGEACCALPVGGCTCTACGTPACTC